MSKPPALQQGDTIGVMATSNWVDQADLDATKTFLEARGYCVFIHPQATARLNQSAGNARGKVEAFHDLIRNPDIKAIFGARGGNRAITMPLAGLDFNLIAAHPKIIMGYSDLTILLNSIYQKTGLVTFHGPLFHELPNRDGTEIGQMLELLGGQTPSYDFSQAAILQEGTAQGPLIGGNLSMLQTLLGTLYQPDTDGAILFFEDAGDHLSRYDRMIAHLKLAGFFNKISGLIVGRLTDVQDNPERPFGFTLEDVLREHLADYDIPVVMDAPFGHNGPLPTFPVGAQAYLEATDHDIAFKLIAPACLNGA